MPLYKFKEGDVLRNRIKSYPKNYFLIASGSIFYNNLNPEKRSFDPGTFNYINHIGNGNISLYEMNVDMPSGQLIYPFVTKQGSLSSFKTITTRTFQTASYGSDIKPLESKYPLSSSLAIDYIESTDERKRIKALKNTLNFYKKNSVHYSFSSSFGDKVSQDLTLISIPSIFYGSSIKKGSVKLSFYHTGSLAGELQDNRKNGELVQITPSGQTGSIAGVVLYNEGFIVLTGSWSIHQSYTDDFTDSTVAPLWRHWGNNYADTPSASWGLEFEGTSYTPVVTMFAHAPKGFLNHSNNPTYIQQHTNSAGTVVEHDVFTGSQVYIEDPKMPLTNIVSASYNEPSASFRKNTYISKVGVFDKNKNLIAVAKVATPVKKTEEREYTFKLKLDI